ncbi:fip1 motif family protein [Chrysochromulina tobinii]|uniref:Fip1 motif family protein n=1 Tax=Chrysochromulina tobinii TaxID=1460289 RepID=A0A0M0KAF4_9EUKA|nr:fip1 motif family protein [Chrysochromulina tobinii]|eukprot:KOO35393.1 fip1 motif family protein [Chrysochromulina sp. CCMP291]
MDANALDLASDVSSEDDGIRIVLHYPDELDEGEEGMLYAEDSSAAMADGAAAGEGMAGTQPPTLGPSASVCSASSAGTTPASNAAKASRHKVYVNPRLQALASAGAGTGGSPGAISMTPPAPHKQPAITAAQRAKLGPLVHVPGGLQMSLEGPMPENIDIDQLAEKPWHKPDVDPTDYFNYGFTEDTWRLYCKRQQEIRAEVRTLSQMQVPTFNGASTGMFMGAPGGMMGGGMGAGMMGGGMANGMGACAGFGSACAGAAAIGRGGPTQMGFVPGGPMGGGVSLPMPGMGGRAQLPGMGCNSGMGNHVGMGGSSMGGNGMGGNGMGGNGMGGNGMGGNGMGGNGMGGNSMGGNSMGGNGVLF